MFSARHFIWLGVLGAIIAVLLVFIKKKNVSGKIISKTVLFALVALKVFHLCLSMKESEFGGYVIDQSQLSFHLCSVMIYAVVLINVIKNEKFVTVMKSFMVPCMLIGAAMALLIPTAGVEFTKPRVWEFMLAHGTLVFYGVYLMIIEKVDLSLKVFFTNLKLLLALVMLAFLMNSVLEQYETNFMFLRKPPMDDLPILNLNNGWHVYFITLAFIACALLFSVHLPFVIKNMRAKKKAAKSAAEKIPVAK